MATIDQSQADPVTTLFPDLVGSRMVIIGAGSIGLSAARLARTLGVTVVMANRSQGKLDQVKAEMPEVDCYQVNARDQASINEVLDAARPDHIVLTTGRVVGFSSGSIDLAEIMDYFGDRMEPIVAIANWVALRNPKPRSFTIVSGFIGQPAMGNLAWSAVGPAIKGAAEHLAVELGPTRVNVVAPGPLVDSKMAYDVAGSDAGVRKMTESLAAQLPIGRAVVIEDAARQVLYVAGDPVATGSMRFVEGGLAFVPSTMLKDLHMDEKDH